MEPIHIYLLAALVTNAVLVAYFVYRQAVINSKLRMLDHSYRVTSKVMSRILLSQSNTSSNPESPGLKPERSTLPFGEDLRIRREVNFISPFSE